MIKKLHYLYSTNNIIISKGNKYGSKIYVDDSPHLMYLVLAIPIIGNIVSFIAFILSLFDVKYIGKDDDKVLYKLESGGK